MYKALLPPLDTMHDLRPLEPCSDLWLVGFLYTRRSSLCLPKTKQLQQVLVHVDRQPVTETVQSKSWLGESPSRELESFVHSSDMVDAKMPIFQKGTLKTQPSKTE